MADPAARGFRFCAFGVQGLPVTFVACWPLAVAFLAVVRRPLVAASTVDGVDFLGVDLKPVGGQMVFGYVLAGVTLDALLAGLLAIVAGFKAHSHGRAVETLLVYAVNELLMTDHAVDLEDLDVGAMRNKKIAVGRDLSVSCVAGSTGGVVRCAKQVRVRRPGNQLRVERRDRAQGK